MFTAPFWKAAGERAIRTVAQTLLALWLVGDVAFNAVAVDWGQALGVGAGAGILSLLTSLTAEWVQPATGPSLGTEKPLAVGGVHRRPGDVGPEAGQTNNLLIAIVALLAIVVLVVLLLRLA